MSQLNMSNLSRLILGCGGHARALISVLMESLEFSDIGLIENQIGFDKKETILGAQVVGDLSFLNNCSTSIILGVGSINARIDVLQKYKFLSWCNVISTKAVISPKVTIGDGVFIAPNTFLGPLSTISNHAIINTSSVIEHEVHVGENSHIAPNSTLLGKCSIGQNVFVGANTVVLPNISIGDNITIGANSLVNKSLFEPGTYIGTPARKI